MLRILILTAAILPLSGCYLSVIITQGGTVEGFPTGGTYHPGNAYVIDIIDTNFNRTFTAVPSFDYPYQFVKWADGDNFLCAGSTNPSCVVNNTVLEGNAIGEAIIASDTEYFLMPIFELVCPPGQKPNPLGLGCVNE